MKQTVLVSLFPESGAAVKINRIADALTGLHHVVSPETTHDGRHDEGT